MFNDDVYSLNNINNYKEVINSSSITIIELYNKNIDMFIDKSIKIKNIKNYNFFIIKGIEILGYVFKFFILYTKNIELTDYYSVKSIFYFIEFLQQMNNYKHDLLNLTLQDAVMFVYKKTIFNINKNLCKNINNHLINDNLDIFINIHTLFNNKICNYVNIHKFIKFIKSYNINNENELNYLLNTIFIFINKIDIDINYLNDKFMKKIKIYSKEYIENIRYKLSNNMYLLTNDYDKYTTSLFI